MVGNIRLNHNNNVYIGSQHKTATPEEFVHDKGVLAEYQMSVEASAASRAYAQAMLNKKAPQLSFDETIQKLEQAGINYRFERAPIGNYFIELLNKNLDPIKEYNWNNGKDAKNFAGCTEYQYDGRRRTGYVHHINGKPLIINKTYYNDKTPQEMLTKEGFTYKTTPDDYIKYLENNDIRFSMKEDMGTLKIQEFNKNNTVKKIVSWVMPGPENEFKNPDISFLNGDGDEFKRIYFNEYSTEITNYLNWRGEKDIKQE